MREVNLSNLVAIVNFADATAPAILVCERKSASFVQHALEVAYPEGRFVTFTIDDDTSGDGSNHEDMIYSVIG